jgi:hypothetical protein
LIGGHFGLVKLVADGFPAPMLDFDLGKKLHFGSIFYKEIFSVNLERCVLLRN